MSAINNGNMGTVLGKRSGGNVSCPQFSLKRQKPSQEKEDVKNESGMPDEKGYTALHHAAKQGFVSGITMLVKAGADLDVCDSKGCTPMHHAALYNQRAAIEHLKQLGANIDAVDNGGNTALHYLAMKGRVGVYKALVLQGANPGIQNKAGKIAQDYLPKQKDLDIRGDY